MVILLVGVPAKKPVNESLLSLMKNGAAAEVKAVHENGASDSTKMKVIQPTAHIDPSLGGNCKEKETSLPSSGTACNPREDLPKKTR